MLHRIRWPGVDLSVDPALRYQGDFVPVLLAEIDFESVRLDADDRHLFSRIDGRTNVRELSSLLGIPPLKVAAGLMRLEAQGVISAPSGMSRLTIEDVDLPVESSAAVGPVSKRINQVHEADLVGVGRYAGFRFSRQALEEVNDLPMSVRKELLWCEDRGDILNPFDLFDLPASASQDLSIEVINRKLRMFHPDTYFDHDLGTFGPMILRQAGRLRTASAPLLDEELRAELRRELLEKGAIRDEAYEARKKHTQEEKDRRQMELRRRRMARNPMFARITKAKAIYQEAMGYFEERNWIKAHNGIKAAQTFDPNNELYQELEERFGRRAADERAERHVKAAEFNEGVGRWDRAAAAYIYAAKIAEHRPDYWAKAAEMSLRVGDDLQTASDFAQKAIDQDPNNPSYLRVMLAIFDGAGMVAKSSAIAARILELDPTAADVADRLKRDLKRK
jgi:tetratricopeptide (TPR) repeat protein